MIISFGHKSNFISRTNGINSFSIFLGHFIGLAVNPIFVTGSRTAETLFQLYFVVPGFTRFTEILLLWNCYSSSRSDANIQLNLGKHYSERVHWKELTTTINCSQCEPFKNVYSSIFYRIIRFVATRLYTLCVKLSFIFSCSFIKVSGHRCYITILLKKTAQNEWEHIIFILVLFICALEFSVYFFISIIR